MQLYHDKIMGAISGLDGIWAKEVFRQQGCSTSRLVFLAAGIAMIVGFMMCDGGFETVCPEFAYHSIEQNSDQHTGKNIFGKCGRHLVLMADDGDADVFYEDIEQ